jgi:ribose 5-phosphate isomerase B
MRIYIASDHGGYWLKDSIKQDLLSHGHEVVDVGNSSYDPNDDYPDYVIPLAEKVVEDAGTVGIIIGRSGNGEAIAANKVKGIRAAVCLTEDMSRIAREHNNANILSLGSSFVDIHRAGRIIEVFLESMFTADERHTRRLDKISLYEASKN